MSIKNLFLYLTISGLSSIASCQSKPGQKSASIIKSIEFVSNTRGYQKQVFISPDSVIEFTEKLNKGQRISKPNTEQQWIELISTIDAVPLQGIDKLPSPTSRRAFDGAKHSSLIITTNDSKSHTHTFDDENPHEQLLPLMKAIRKLKTPD